MGGLHAPDLAAGALFFLLAKLRDKQPRKQLHHHPQQGVYSLHQENLRAQVSMSLAAGAHWRF